MLFIDNKLRNEYIVFLFALFLTLTITILVYEYNIVINLIRSIWITFSLVISSFIFRFFIQLIFKDIGIYFPYYKLVCPIIFWLLSLIIPINILIIFSITGAINYVRRYGLKFYKINILNIFFFSLLYFLIIGSESWNMHRNPLPCNFLITQSGTGSDVTFFSSITSMIKIHNSCSIGIDGLQSFPYHYGTYLFLANLSSILKLNPLHINNIISPLILLPLSLHIMLEFLNIIKSQISTVKSYISLTFFDHLIFAALLTTLTNAPFGLPFVANLSFFTSPFQIDSQLLGNIFCLLILVLLVNYNFNCFKTLYARMVFLLIFQFIICFIKSPVSHLTMVAITYTCLRYSFLRSATTNKIWFTTTLFCVALTIYAGYFTSFSGIKNEGILSYDLFSLWFKNIPLREWHWIYLSNGFYTFATILVLAYLFRHKSLQKIVLNFKNSSFILFEVLIVLTFISISLSGVFGGALSFASTYYMDSVKFISLIFFSACSSVLFSKDKFKNKYLSHFLITNSPLKFLAFISICFLLITGIGLSLKGWSRTLNKYKESDLTNPDPPEITQKKIDTLRTLLNLSKNNVNKRESCLWIPKSNTLFWNELTEENNVAFLPFWPVSLSEMSLIDGYPLSNKSSGSFGYEAYGTDLFHKRDKKLYEIKSIAKTKGFKTLVVLWDHKNYETFSLLHK